MPATRCSAPLGVAGVDAVRSSARQSLPRDGRSRTPVVRQVRAGWSQHLGLPVRRSPDLREGVRADDVAVADYRIGGADAAACAGPGRGWTFEVTSIRHLLIARSVRFGDPFHSLVAASRSLEPGSAILTGRRLPRVGKMRQLLSDLPLSHEHGCGLSETPDFGGDHGDARGTSLTENLGSPRTAPEVADGCPPSPASGPR